MKYILEIKPKYDIFKGLMILGAKDSNLFVDTIAVEDLEELNSDYINEHYGSLQDEAYKRGINDGSLDVKQRVEGAYQQGLDDAWEAARNISMLKSDGGYSWKEMKSIFGTDSASEIYVHHTAAEAINKIKAYEEKQNDKIVVGDEFVTGTGERFVVLRVDENGEVDRYFDSEGRTYRMNVKYPSMKKTGRHFDIASILEDMRND